EPCATPDRPRPWRRAPGDARDQRVPSGQPAGLGPRRLRHARVLGAGDDRSQRPVHVQQQRGVVGPFRQPGEKGGRFHAPYDTPMALVLIGLVAGFFSALFGVGGGIVVVPLLLLWQRWSERPAMATSLAAIGIIALAGTIS